MPPSHPFQNLEKKRRRLKEAKRVVKGQEHDREKRDMHKTGANTGEQMFKGMGEMMTGGRVKMPKMRMTRKSTP